MAIDTPAKIAIIGAGPIGLEAALYARYLGYEVEVFDIDPAPASGVRNYGGLPMYTPFGMNRSSLGLAALQAQHDNYKPPPDDAVLAYSEWYESYLLPLANSDLIVDSLRLQTLVISAGKVELTKTDFPTGEYNRGNWDFRLMVGKELTRQSFATADILFDCGGLFAKKRAMGHGGLKALGEDILNFTIGTSNDAPPTPRNFSRFLGNSILVVGDDHFAIFTILSLAELAKKNPNTRITWVTRKSAEDAPHGPLLYDEHDPLPERAKFIFAANELVRSGQVTWWPETWIEAIESAGEQWRVTFSGAREESHEFYQILNHNSGVPSHAELRELVLDLCPRSEAPRPFSESLLARKSTLDIRYPASSPAALITSEPNFYILGAKSFGRLPGFLYQHGLRQIRDVFTIIGDRADLDLYAKYDSQAKL